MNFRSYFAWAALLVFAGAVFAEGSSPPPGMALVPVGNYKPLYQAAGAATSIPVPAFYLDVRPVTNAEFLAFLQANPKWRRSQVSPLFAESGYLGDWAGDLELGPRAPAGSPVANISWFAAQAFARWKGKRLPTTAEWERAADAGFAVENGASDPVYRKTVLAWFSKPTESTLPSAGSGRANFYGIRDMVDLDWEWVNDFNSVLLTDDSNGSVRTLFCGAASIGVRDFTNYPAFMRAGFRSSLRANYVMPDLSFRCAKTP